MPFPHSFAQQSPSDSSNLRDILELPRSALDEVLDFFNSPLFNIGRTEITPRGLILFSVAVYVVYYLAGVVRRLLVNRILASYITELGVRQAIGTIVQYVVIVIGLYIVTQATGIDLSGLGILAGALGVGIGFGLQNITSNFISGIIILFERPIKVGDRITVNNTDGNVIKISARATTIVTNDNIAVIVPNSDFISGTVTNWSYTDRLVRFNIPVGVSYREDPRVVEKLLLEVVAQNAGVLKDPPPDVLFKEYADSALIFNLRVWTTKFVDRPPVLKSQLYYAIFEKFRQHDIEIPFPQRDLHVRSGLEVFNGHRPAPKPAAEAKDES